MSSSPNRSKITPFVESAIHNATKTIGGILSSSLIAWTVFGPHLRVLDLRTGLRINSWHFGNSVRDYNTKILSVVELKNPQISMERVPLLAVGLSSGLVCIYEPVTNRILRAIVVGAPVTSLAVVDGHRLELNGTGSLFEAFDGVLVAGLGGGDVLLLDLCRQSINEALNIYSRSILRNEERPCEITMIYRGDLGSLSGLKECAANAGQHLAYHLNYHPTMDQDLKLDTHNDVEPHFPLQSAAGDILIFAPRSHVAVTSLLYTAPLHSVLVGYSFGCWQILSLLDDSRVVLYTSLLHRERIPVRWFALQEPSDDPRTCCYVWAVHDDGSCDNRTAQGVVGCAVMYVLSYERKEWHEGYGWMYELLNSCAIRFQMDLTNDFPANNPSISHNVTSHCISVRSYSLGTSSIHQAHHSSTSHHINSNDDPLELCALSYIATVTTLDGQRQTQVYILLFDLNQWYLSQMPGEPQGRQCETYMTRVCVSGEEGVEDGVGLLDVRLDERAVRGFRMRLRRLEEHFRPDALSYSCTILTSTNSSKLYHLGTQSHLLQQLSALGPLALLKPGHLYTHALTCGLVTANNTFLLHGQQPTLQQQREILLDIALEQHLQNVLESCVTEWADGSSLAVGCAVHGWLLEWAWTRATQLKREIDQTLYVHVFDGNSVVDTRIKVQLDCYAGQLGRIRKLFEHVQTLGGGEEDVWKVERRVQTLGAVCRWIGVIRWLLEIGLLPENAGIGERGVDSLFDRIRSILEKRRCAININKYNLSRNLPAPQLYIDSLIIQELGSYSVISNLWKNATKGIQTNNYDIYPPNSLQAALRTYLIQAQIQHKDSINHHMLLQYQHYLFYYLMLDIAQEVNEKIATINGQLKQHLVSFPLTFNIDLKQSKLVQAMWLLDRADFAQAMEQLVDPSVTVHAPPWLHKCVIVQLLAQAQHRFALLYMQLRRPPSLGYVMHEGDDDCMMCTLFVRNGRLYDALKYARERARRSPKVSGTTRTHEISDTTAVEESKDEDEDQKNDNLLSHIWSECLQTDLLNNKIITSVYGLNSLEEKSLFNYMDRIEYPNRHIMRSIFTLQHTISQNQGKLTVQPKHQYITALTDESKFYENMLNTVLRKTDLMNREPKNMDCKIDGSIPMSVLIHYNNFISSKTKNKTLKNKVDTVVQTSMLWTIHDTCTATIRATLYRQQQQELIEGQKQQRHFRGEKRKLHNVMHIQQTVKRNDNVLIQTSIASKLLPQQQSLSLNRELQLIQSHDNEQYSSPRKKIKYNASVTTTDSSFNQQLQSISELNKSVIDTSYQMDTPLVKRSHPVHGQQETNPQYATTPSLIINKNNIGEMDTPLSILKKRQTLTTISDNSGELSVETECATRKLITPQVLVNIYKEQISPKSRRSIGRSINGTAISQATVRFDISLSTTMSASDSTTANNSNDITNTTGVTSATTSSTNLTFCSPNDSCSLQMNNELLNVQKLDDIDLNKAKEVDDAKCEKEIDDYNTDGIEDSNETLSKMLVWGKSPMKRKSIRELFEEPPMEIRNSPRLMQRRSLDREMKKSNFMESNLQTSTITYANFTETVPIVVDRDIPQNHQNPTTSDTMQFELTPLFTDIQSKKGKIRKSKSNLFIDSSLHPRSELLKEHDFKTTSLTTSKCPMLSIYGIEQLHEKSVVTIDRDEMLSEMETIETADIVKRNTISNDVEAFNVAENNKSESADGFINLINMDVGYFTNLSVEPSNKTDSVEIADALEEKFDESIDIYEDLYDVSQAHLLKTAMEEEMGFDEDDGETDDKHASVIEISSSNSSTVANLSIKSSDRGELKNYRSTEDSFNGLHDESNESTKYSLNRVTFLKEDSRLTGGLSNVSKNTSDSQRSSYSIEDSVKSADRGHLYDDGIDTNEEGNTSDIYLKETDDVESNDVNNSNKKVKDISTFAENDEDGVSKNEESNDSLNINTNEETIIDDSKETSQSGLVHNDVSETIGSTGTFKDIEGKKGICLLKSSGLDNSTGGVQNEIFKTGTNVANLSESVDILQITLMNDNIDSIAMEQDILCMTFTETDLSRKTVDSLRDHQISFKIYEKNVEVLTEVDPLIEESVAEEYIHVDPDILTITFNEKDKQNHNITKTKAINNNALESTGNQAIEDNDRKSIGPTRRSARLRKDSTSSVISNSSDLTSTSDQAFYKTVVGSFSSKLLRKTQRSFSTDEESIQFQETALIASKPVARRSNRRTRSVDAPTIEQSDINQWQNRTQWLSTIVEEHSQGTAATNPLLSRCAIEAVGEVVRDVIWSANKAERTRRQRRSASVDSSPMTMQKAITPKRGRPRKTAESSPVSTISNLDKKTTSGSPMLTRTRARTNSISSTKSDSCPISTSRRFLIHSEKLLEKDAEIDNDVTGSTEEKVTLTLKRSGRGNKLPK